MMMKMTATIPATKMIAFKMLTMTFGRVVSVLQPAAVLTSVEIELSLQSIAWAGAIIAVLPLTSPTRPINNVAILVNLVFI